ncbi:hypothetical protein [Myceligenerans pegani]|uniref:Uncharacterized protein n=1 Tax=Myceligenerans pegani TaxID=2776917 RepID=A0ABR9MUJ2_9MICO|nr:hypothetical protein [Myceligenerans sp. TRM 65318]MBE1874721.1 hypothetical protein [Myceligenerans sp. TRM 65318]MBE3016992.1 hypothetical protein [Myceligenerans sp. TRM 65318]
MSLWGTAMDAEVQYRREELKKAWGGRTRKAPKDKRRGGARTPAEKRGTQIRRGLSGMGPEPAHRGLFA